MNVVCIGDCGVDRYGALGKDLPGGITYNVAQHARRLFPSSATVRIVTAIGTDEESNLIRKALDASLCEVQLNSVEGRTSLQEVDLQSSGEKLFVRYDQGVLGGYRLSDEDKELVAQSDLLITPMYEQILLFFESVMATSSSGLRAVDFADISNYPIIERVQVFIEQFDIGFFGLAKHDTKLINGLAEIARAQDKLFVITLGEHGSLAFSRTVRAFQPANPVAKVVDTTGAGDSFAAGFLSEYVYSRHIVKALRKGARVAAETIGHLGAT